MGQTYYEILGVAENATAAEIEAAFKAKAREVHPDTVPAENTYLRKVAAEAFKDLSEAKAALLDPATRQKYDAGLASSRSTEQTRPEPGAAASSGANEPPRSSSHSRRSSRSPNSVSSAQTAAGTARRTRPLPHLPEIKNLDSFLFMILGMASIFFLAALVWSGRMPPVWLAAITAGLGILSFVNGMRPVAPSYSSGRRALILSTGLVAIVLFSLWLLSPSYFEIATSRVASSAASPSSVTKKAQPTAASHRAAESPTVAVVDESGEDAALPTRVWTNLKDGQIYRTRVNGDALFLDAIATAGKSDGEITSCEFRRAGADAANWIGICSERGSSGEPERKSPATLSRFSDVRLEGSTSDIPVFVMTPVEVGAAPPVSPQVAPRVGPPAEGEITAEPDLSGLRDVDRQSIESTCASDKLTQGPAKYNECVQTQVDALKKSPRPRGFAKLGSQDRDAVEYACLSAKLTQGPAAYNQCLAKQIAILKKQKP